MRALRAAAPLLLLASACLDFHTGDPCGRFTDRAAPASCTAADGGAGDGGALPPDGGSAPATCPAPVAPSGGAGDILQACTPADGGGSPDCAAGEACVNFVGTYRCTRYCGTDPTVCQGSTLCRARDFSAGSMPAVCLPTCNPHQPGLGCPQAWACAPTSPNFDDPGVCLPHCASFGCSGSSQCDSVSGVCGCTASSCPADPFDASASLQCDLVSRVCYRPCASGCGSSCCDASGSPHFCRVQPGAGGVCDHCTQDADCATLFCDPSSGRCNSSSDDCSGTGECEHIGTSCVAYSCVCRAG